MTAPTFQYFIDQLRQERVLLIGGAGFIGHNLALTLGENGVPTMVADNLMVNNVVNNVEDSDVEPMRRQLNLNFLLDRFEMLRERGVSLRNCDARLTHDLTRVFDDFKPTKIVHLAAIASAVEANKNPGLCFDLQLLTLRNVLELCRLSDEKINEVVLLSSSTVYGDFNAPTVDESTRPNPRGIYANTKYMAERLVRTYSHIHGQPITIIRPSALYGERCVSRRVSQVFIENALMGKTLLLEGGGDGRLDFTHVEDLAQGIIRSMGDRKDRSYTNTFNITYGNARTIAELAAIVKDVVPHAILEDRPRAVDKPIRGTLSTDRAREALGFEPRWNLDDGYRRYCEWYVDQWERARRN